MRGPFLFPLLAGQTVVALRVCEPWVAALPPTTGPAPLFGAIALQCNRHALLCHSPDRYLGNPKGSRIGLYGGGTAELPFRASLCEVDELEHWLPLTGGAHWSHRANPMLPMQGDVLAEAPQMVRDGDSGPWQLEFRFGTGRCFSLQYRTDMDVSLQFAPLGHHFHAAPPVTVSSPDAEFGWLHPASPYPFALDDRCWRSAHPRDWPLPLQRAWQSQPTGTSYRETMRRALIARFAQHDSLRRRLFALRSKVSVAGVPDGLIEEVAALLRTLHGQRPHDVVQ